MTNNKINLRQWLLLSLCLMLVISLVPATSSGQVSAPEEQQSLLNIPQRLSEMNGDPRHILELKRLPNPPAGMIPGVASEQIRLFVLLTNILLFKDWPNLDFILTDGNKEAAAGHAFLAIPQKDLDEQGLNISALNVAYRNDTGGDLDKLIANPKTDLEIRDPDGQLIARFLLSLIPKNAAYHFQQKNKNWTPVATNSVVDVIKAGEYFLGNLLLQLKNYFVHLVNPRFEGGAFVRFLLKNPKGIIVAATDWLAIIHHHPLATFLLKFPANLTGVHQLVADVLSLNATDPVAARIYYPQPKGGLRGLLEILGKINIFK